MSLATVIVPTVRGGPRLARLLESLDGDSGAAEILVVDNGSHDPGMDALGTRFARVRVIRLDDNVGYSRAVNLAAREAAGEALVLLNDDCVCDPGYVPAIVAPLDPAADVTMAAGVMREARDPTRIDTAGMQLDGTLLVFDYLNGERVTRLDQGVPDPIGPSGAAAAFDRGAFLEAGGFDENLFAYWEDVDLVLRMRCRGARCRLAPGARGIHDHSGTLGSGSRRKNYLMGFGRGYVLRKWSVLGSPGRAARVLVTDGTVCLGQLVVDRNLAGVEGRVRGYRAARPRAPFPEQALPARDAAETAWRTLGRRARRRARLRERGVPEAGWDRIRALAVFHVAEVSGPLRALTNELRWLAAVGDLIVVAPGRGAVTDELGEVATVDTLDFTPLMLPGRTAGALAHPVRLGREARRFRELIRRERADLVLIVSSRLPAALIAARRERVPTLIYAAEIHHGPGVGSRPRRRLGLGLLRLTARGADAVIVPSRTAAAQFPAALRAKVRVVYPPVTADSARGDAERFRRRHGIGAHEPCILVVGNLTPPRGQDLLLRCLPSIRSRVAGARLVLVGPTFDRPRDVAFEAELGALAKTLGISSALTLAGYEPEIADAYAAASVVVNPGLSTHPESFGLAACEALVAGRPVVTARVGAVSEVLDGVPGVEMVPPGDPEQLADAVVRMLVDSERAGGAARDGGQEVLRRFPPERSMAAFREVVEGIAPAARHRSTPGRASSPPS